MTASPFPTSPFPTSPFRVAPGQIVSLSGYDPADDTAFPDKKAVKMGSAKDVAAIDELQVRLFAEKRRALLVVLQGIDTAGKDGTIRHVFHETSPLGVTVASFRRPSEQELAHDFLWRAHAACPRRGTIGIFNRSHYEDVLAVRVHELAPVEEIDARYDQINAFESILTANGTTVLKFFLHISKAEQGKRLQDRLDDPKSHWKFNPNDLADRKRWDDYTQAFELMLRRCSTDIAPWYIIPSDHKWVRNAAISHIIRETLETMNPQYAQPDWDPKSFKID